MSPEKTRIAAAGLLTLLVGIGVVITPSARADFYKYRDGSGAVCITNDPNTIPPKYRASMKVVRDEALEKKETDTRKLAPRKTPPVARENAAAGLEQAPAAEPPSRFASLAARFPWFKPLVIVAAIGALFLLVVKITTLLPSPLLARLIYLAFFLGVSVFGYKMYAESMLNSYQTIRTKVLAMFTKANERQAPETGDKAPVSTPGGQSLKVE